MEEGDVTDVTCANQYNQWLVILMIWKYLECSSLLHPSLWKPDCLKNVQPRLFGSLWHKNQIDWWFCDCLQASCVGPIGAGMGTQNPANEDITILWSTHHYYLHVLIKSLVSCPKPSCSSHHFWIINFQTFFLAAVWDQHSQPSTTPPKRLAEVFVIPRLDLHRTS